MIFNNGDVLTQEDIEAIAQMVNDARLFLEIGLTQKAADALQIACEYLPETQYQEFDPNQKLSFRGY